MATERVTPGLPGRYNPTAQEVQHLLRRAAEHPLGPEFLSRGALDAVSATFGVHAFVVEAARSALAAAVRQPVAAARDRD